MDIDKISAIAKEYFKDAVAGHDWFHVERVHKLAMHIGRLEGADLSILEPAVLLHDIGRTAEDKGAVDCHAKEGARLAKEILAGLNYPKDKVEKIARCIAVHRYKDQFKPESKEEKVLQDADRLDALGAVGIARIFAFGGEHKREIYNPAVQPAEYKSAANTSLNHFYEKIFNIKPETFKTQTARELAKDRYAFTKLFVDKFLKEWIGEQ